MKRHMLEQHQERSKEYLSLSVEQKTLYFDPSTAGARKEDSPRGRFFLPPPTDDEQLNIWLDKAIVEGIIGNLFSRCSSFKTMVKLWMTILRRKRKMLALNGILQL